MRDLYLLAASLLTGWAIPASTLPHLSIILPENSRIQSNFQQVSQLTIGERIISPVDISLSQLSNQALQPLKPLPVSRASLLNPSAKISSRVLVSGSQLYYQRLAALKTGQIYKRVDDDSLQSLWESGKKSQLTYEDWKNLLALEAKALAQGQGANHLSILVGDSLSMWFPKEKLPAGKIWLNQGISGDTSNGIFKRLVAFSATRPDVIYIMAGINDLRKGTTDEVILRNHRQIMRRLRQTHPKAEIIIQSILPTRLPTIPNRRIRHLNAQLAVIAKEEGANYLNIHNWFTDFEGNLRFDLTTDGLHLSPEGYDVWRAALEQMELKLTKR
ncbi:MAG: SGNH/GDSL hydrolase family protein [Gloeotrichia echinulata DVL01]|jgi:lysophospholipase L1-like esterase|nr:G-D-S-L family lipolytic protein [Gloeotrichia echinulata DEX184]